VRSAREASRNLRQKNRVNTDIGFRHAVGFPEAIARARRGWRSRAFSPTDAIRDSSSFLSSPPISVISVYHAVRNTRGRHTAPLAGHSNDRAFGLRREKPSVRVRHFHRRISNAYSDRLRPRSQRRAGERRTRDRPEGYYTMLHLSRRSSSIPTSLALAREVSCNIGYQSAKTYIGHLLGNKCPRSRLLRASWHGNRK